jgi:hypothetical protein
VQLLEPGEGEVLEELTPQPARAHHQHLHDAPQHVPQLRAEISDEEHTQHIER